MTECTAVFVTVTSSKPKYSAHDNGLRSSSSCRSFFDVTSLPKINLGPYANPVWTPSSSGDAVISILKYKRDFNFIVKALRIDEWHRLVLISAKSNIKLSSMSDSRRTTKFITHLRYFRRVGLLTDAIKYRSVTKNKQVKIDIHRWSTGIVHDKRERLFYYFFDFFSRTSSSMSL